MRVTVKVDIGKGKIMEARGLGKSDRVRKYLASEVARLSEPYVPMRQGTLKNTRKISADGSEIVYLSPYAHYQWYGEAMGGRPPKKYTGKALSYGGGATRGKMWTVRMLADRKKDIEKSIRLYMGRGIK